MRDATSLIGKFINLKQDVPYIIDNFQFSCKGELYVTLRKPDNNTVNWRYEELLPYLKQNFPNECQ
jgi:hypothetical protein